ncbi:MAG: pilus assembly protein PilP [Methylococcales bacterium]|nr:pilus assembly protein PilP [Methylococcales bacterium]
MDQYKLLLPFRKLFNFLVICIIPLCLLSACSGDFSDLNQYIPAVKARPKGPIQSLPEVKIVEPFIFKPEGLRDPFKPLDKLQQDGQMDLSGSGIHPDINRRKEDLESFPLDSLKMVGTVRMKPSLWGLVKTSDGTIHRVQAGNYMGINNGKIINISSNKIDLIEIVPDKPGTWREQLTSLVLTESDYGDNK